MMGSLVECVQFGCVHRDRVFVDSLCYLRSSLLFASPIEKACPVEFMPGDSLIIIGGVVISSSLSTLTCTSTDTAVTTDGAKVLASIMNYFTPHLPTKSEVARCLRSGFTCGVPQKHAYDRTARSAPLPSLTPIEISTYRTRGLIAANLLVAA
ncbi:hypothetical protein BDY19DRAFT_388586 [Irpex rosettiformis]|uniref:Uncharacterized protein n=1 Tax=Irpex rosettiformis TaxID=378272 RepID=A0ACB8TVD5_9APHY|nr:hypothetical protein BDY19DRAFT_388586 [Irpex rosettiformis]